MDPITWVFTLAATGIGMIEKIVNLKERLRANQDSNPRPIQILREKARIRPKGDFDSLIDYLELGRPIAAEILSRSIRQMYITGLVALGISGGVVAYSYFGPKNDWIVTYGNMLVCALAVFLCLPSTQRLGRFRSLKRIGASAARHLRPSRWNSQFRPWLKPLRELIRGYYAVVRWALWRVSANESDFLETYFLVSARVNAIERYELSCQLSNLSSVLFEEYRESIRNILISSIVRLVAEGRLISPPPPAGMKEWSWKQRRTIARTWASHGLESYAKGVALSFFENDFTVLAATSRRFQLEDLIRNTFG